MYSRAAAIAQRIEIDHQIGLAVHVREDDAFAFGVVFVATGEIIAWDGWYGFALPDQSVSIENVDWDDYGVHPAEALVEANRPWLGSHLGDFLMPTYSVAREAVRLTASRWHSEDDDQTSERFASSSVSAYLPIVDLDVLLAELRRRAVDRPELADLFLAIDPSWGGDQQQGK